VEIFRTKKFLVLIVELFYFIMLLLCVLNFNPKSMRNLFFLFTVFFLLITSYSYCHTKFGAIEGFDILNDGPDVAENGDSCVFLFVRAFSMIKLPDKCSFQPKILQSMKDINTSQEAICMD
jgi:hypothetical protein